MAKIIGAFVFEDFGDGCLTGKWLNNDEPTPYPEAAKLKMSNVEKINSKNSFEGNYTTIWVETIDQPMNCDLIITKYSNDVFNVEWRKNDNILFYGRGMLFKEMLIGTYWR